MLRARQKATQYRSWSLSDRALHKNRAQNSSWSVPGSAWEGSEAVLDASWTSLGRLLAALGRLLDPLGRFLATSWALSGGTWLISGAFWVHFNSPKRSGPRFWRVWEHAGLGFRRLGRHVLACTSLRLAFHYIMLFMTAVTTLLHLPALCFFPLRRGGLCAAHGIRISFTPSRIVFRTTGCMLPS